MRHRWKYVGKTEYATIYIDSSLRKTKIMGEKFIYLHNGIYPYHNPDPIRKYRK